MSRRRLKPPWNLNTAKQAGGRFERLTAIKFHAKHQKAKENNNEFLQNKSREFKRLLRRNWADNKRETAWNELVLWRDSGGRIFIVHNKSSINAKIPKKYRQRLYISRPWRKMFLKPPQVCLKFVWLRNRMWMHTILGWEIFTPDKKMDGCYCHKFYDFQTWPSRLWTLWTLSSPDILLQRQVWTPLRIRLK